MHDLTKLVAPRIAARSGAFARIIRRAGWMELLRPAQSPLGRLRLACLSALSTLRDQATAELTELLQAHAHGTTPRALDLPYRPTLPEDRGRALRDRALGATFSTEALRALDDHDRRWAETVLLSRLGMSDHRAAPALHALGVPRLSIHLRAAIAEAHPDNPDTPGFHTICHQVLHTLDAEEPAP